MDKKIILLNHISDLKLENKITVLVGGCFDIVHIGHVRFLLKAKSQGEILIILLESDRFIRLKKAREPLHNQNERAVILSHIDFIDYIIPIPLFNSGRDYLKIIKMIKPKIIAVTINDPQLVSKKYQARIVKAEVKIVSPVIKNKSTTKIFNKIGY